MIFLMLPRINFTKESFEATEARHFKDAMHQQTHREIYGDEAVLNATVQASARILDNKHGITIINHLLGKRGNQESFPGDMIVCKTYEGRNDEILPALFETFSDCRINPNLAIFIHETPISEWKDGSLVPTGNKTMSIVLLAKNGSTLRYETDDDSIGSVTTGQFTTQPDGRISRIRSNRHRGDGEMVSAIVTWLIQNDAFEYISDLHLESIGFDESVKIIKLLDVLQRTFNKDNRSINVHLVGHVQAPVYSLYISSEPVPYYTAVSKEVYDAAVVSLTSFLTEHGASIEVHPDEAPYNVLTKNLNNDCGYTSIWSVNMPDGSYVMSVGPDLRMQVVSADLHQIVKSFRPEEYNGYTPF